MSLKSKVTAILYRAIGEHKSPEKLALSGAFGMYIAFSPFPGLHTVMMFACTWLFALHLPLLFLITSLNNPWTMIPFYSLDYAFGFWVTHNLFNWHPTWNISLEKIFGSGSICIWSFLIGGTILGIISGIVSYPLFLTLFRSMTLNRKK